MKFLHLGNALLAFSLLAVTPGAHAQDKGGADAHRTVADGSAHTGTDMTGLYYDDANTKDCGMGPRGELLPAFFCSGIIIRAAVSGPGYKSWDAPPNDKTADGISFSYLRKDSKFAGLVKGEGSGYTLYPATGKYKYKGAKAKEHVKVICAFPLDGWTEYRGAPSGCGEPTNQPDGGKAGKLCQDQKITTAAEWYKHYSSSTYQNPKLYQCGFDVRPGTHNSADAFMQMIGAMKLLGSVSFYEHNELRIQVSGTDWGEKLPIQSFFYIGQDKGKEWAAARADQKAYYDAFKEFVPVIKINPPKSSDEDYRFHYYADDQVVSPPSS